MKNFFFKGITAQLLFALAVAIILLASCDSKKNTKTNTSNLTVPTINMEIPVLKERQGELANAIEWQKTKDKVAELNAKIQKNPNDIKSRLQIATIYMSEARITGEHPYYYPAILQILEGVLSLDANNFEALTYKASVLMSQHKFKDALAVATKAKDINPDNAYIYGVLVDANVEMGNYDEAVKMSDKMQLIKPSLESYSRASYLREIYGDLDGAIEAMKLAVKAGMPGSEPYCWSKKTLAYLYEQKNDFKTAENIYSSLLLERPSYAFAIEGLARVEKSKGNYEKALEYLNQAIAIMPEFSFHEEIAEIYKLQDQQEKLDAKYKEIIAMLKEDEASGHSIDLDLSKLYVKANMIDSAFVYGMNEYNYRPNNIDVNRNLAQIYVLKGDMLNAKKHLEFASRTGNKNNELIALNKMIN